MPSTRQTDGMVRLSKEAPHYFLPVDTYKDLCDRYSGIWFGAKKKLQYVFLGALLKNNPDSELKVVFDKALRVRDELFGLKEPPPTYKTERYVYQPPANITFYRTDVHTGYSASEPIMPRFDYPPVEIRTDEVRVKTPEDVEYKRKRKSLIKEFWRMHAEVDKKLAPYWNE